jgi:hypothetical protein
LGSVHHLRFGRHIRGIGGGGGGVGGGVGGGGDMIMSTRKCVVMRFYVPLVQKQLDMGCVAKCIYTRKPMNDDIQTDLVQMCDSSYPMVSRYPHTSIHRGIQIRCDVARDFTVVFSRGAD